MLFRSNIKTIVVKGCAGYLPVCSGLIPCLCSLCLTLASYDSQALSTTSCILGTDGDWSLGRKKTPGYFPLLQETCLAAVATPVWLQLLPKLGPYDIRVYRVVPGPGLR